MHGMVFSELKRYIDKKHGGDTWTRLLEKAGIGSKTYSGLQEYPDGEAVGIISAASALAGKPIPTLLEDFGEFIAPTLIRVYGALIKPGWRTLDLIENTERTIHTVVRVKNPGAKPPELVCARPTKDEVIITYSSARKMCSLAKGIASGVAKHYNERIALSEPACMHRGSPACKISIKLVH
jgi:Haem-NO-binding